MARKKRQTVKQFEQWSPKKSAGAPTDALAGAADGTEHFATRKRANEFIHLMRSLPDPDPILRKMGKSIAALAELLTDGHMESVWSVRCSVASGAEWFISAGADGRREQDAAAAFEGQLKNLDIPRIIEEMMGAVAYGYAPLEIIWKADSGLWGFEDIVGKPQQWFEFDQDNRLVFRTIGLTTEPLPENRFLLVQHRASYANPYGDKVFSKCFWPATFKKNGFRWWTVFVEKYGGAFMYGKYPNNASESFKAELLNALESMISDAVAIAPEGSEIEIQTAQDKGGTASIHKDYIAMANAEISKAVLGQTLTTEIGDKGSYAAAAAHNLVREDLATADRRRITAAFNRLAAVFTLYNFGPDVAPPKFEFVQDEDLQKERAERDKKLFAVGWRPKKTYITREYGIPEEDYDLVDNTQAVIEEQEFGRRGLGAETHFSDCGCGCQPPAKKSLFRKMADKFLLLFVSKESRQAEKDLSLMREFEGKAGGKVQESLDAMVGLAVDALGAASNFDEALAAIDTTFTGADAGKRVQDFAEIVQNARYAGFGIRGSHE